MVYFMSKSILVTLRSNSQHKFSSHELTCLQCMSAIVCHTFQIKGSQDGQCLRDARSCWGLWLAALSTGMAGSVVTEPDPWLFLRSRIGACLASWSHGKFYTLSAFKQYGLQQSCVLFPYRSVVKEKGCQSLSG